MNPVSRCKRISVARGLRQVSFAGVAVALLVAACTDDAIVYPNRNLRPAAGESNDAGEAGEATAGAPSAGASQGGNGGAKAGGGSMLGDAGTADGAGAPPTGPVCGDGKLEPPEQCDDGNAISGDGCSANCQSSCEKCEKNVCPLYDRFFDTEADLAFGACYTPSGKILKGSAAGYERAEVCRELVDCIRQESCGQVKNGILKVYRCWCDVDWYKAGAAVACKTEPDPANPQDPTRFVPGPCASLFQDAAESPGLSSVESAFSAVNLAEGRALRLIGNCDNRVCTEECVPGYFNAGAVATITADITATRNAAGESQLGDLVADSQRAIAQTDFAFANFINDDVPVDLLVAPIPNRDSDAPGRVLWSEAFAVIFGWVALTDGSPAHAASTADLKKVTLSGQQIHDALSQQFSPGAGAVLFVSGLKYSYTFNSSDPTASVVSDVRKISDGSLIDPAASYSVALSAQLADGSIPALGQGTNAAIVPGSIAEVLGEYLKQFAQPVVPPELDRITRLN